MKSRDELTFAVRALATERRRSVLALLGAAIGVAAVLVMIAVGEGALRMVRAQFEMLGPNVVAILPGKTETTGAIPGLVGTPRDLTLDDAAALRRTVDSAQAVAPVVIGNVELSVGSRGRRVLALGSTRELQGIRRLEVRTGAFLPDEPWERATPSVVIGAALVDALFPGENPLGRAVRMGPLRLRVIGVLGAQGTHFGVDLDETVIVPVATAMRLFDRASLDRLTVQVRPGYSVARAVERCRAVLLERHGVEDFTITTPDAVLEAFEGIVTMLTLALAAIASISLAVAGIGIMNVMLVSVAERTREIGLLRALGATRGEIARVFLLEAALISGGGGALGMLVGAVAVELASRALPVLPAAVPAWAALAAPALAVAAGLVSALLPAVRAAGLDPVVALTGRRA